MTLDGPLETTPNQNRTRPCKDDNPERGTVRDPSEPKVLPTTIEKPPRQESIQEKDTFSLRKTHIALSRSLKRAHSDARNPDKKGHGRHAAQETFIPQRRAEAERKRILSAATSDRRAEALS